MLQDHLPPLSRTLSKQSLLSVFRIARIACMTYPVPASPSVSIEKNLPDSRRDEALKLRSLMVLFCHAHAGPGKQRVVSMLIHWAQSATTLIIIITT